MKRSLISAMLTVILGMTASAQTARQVTLPLSEDGAARLVVYFPQQPTGRAIVACPGGGYAFLSNTQEGADWSGFFNERGITFALVNYRLPHGDRTLPVTDVEQAMRMMRDSASVWNLNPHDIGIMGSSAGGHLASTIATHETAELRPDFQLLFYPVITMNARGTHQGSLENFLGEQRSDRETVQLYSNERQVHRHMTPPALLLLSNDDAVVPPVPNAVAYYTAMRNAGLPCTMHIYPSGGHGYGFRSDFAYHREMLDDIDAWLAQLPVHTDAQVRVACIGDSITDGDGIDLNDVNGYPAQLERMLGEQYWVRNFGVSARTLMNKGDLPYMNEPAWQEAQAFRPDIVVIKLGTNDSKTANWVHKDTFAGDLQLMIDTLKALPSHPQIYLCTPIPVAHDNFTITEKVLGGEIVPLIRQVARKNGLPVIDLHEALTGQDRLMQRDGIHPTQAGARRMAETVAEQIRRP